MRQLCSLSFPFSKRSYGPARYHYSPYCLDTLPWYGRTIIYLTVPSIGEIGYFQILITVNNIAMNTPWEHPS